MIGLSTVHEQILIALLGAFGIVIAATVPMVWVVVMNRRTVRETKKAVESQGQDVHKVTEHLPPNGDRLYDMVRDVRKAIESVEQQTIHTRVAVVALAERLDNHLEETEPLAAFVQHLMGKEGT